MAGPMLSRRLARPSAPSRPRSRDHPSVRPPSLGQRLGQPPGRRLLPFLHRCCAEKDRADSEAGRERLIATPRGAEGSPATECLQVNWRALSTTVFTEAAHFTSVALLSAGLHLSLVPAEQSYSGNSLMQLCMTVSGGNPLEGEVNISGSKNGALALMAASLLCPEPVTLHGVPALMDIQSMAAVLRSLGVAVSMQGETMEVQARWLSCLRPCETAMRSLRAGFLVIGPLLGREQEAVMALPGGCNIGSRPVDIHLGGLKAMGAEISLEAELLHARCPGGLKGAVINLSFPSVGATETLVMAAVLAQGTSVIHNAAREPEVVAMAEFLNAMGARIAGAGGGTIQVEGVKSLRGGEWTVLPDRIEAGTFAVAAAITRSELLLRPVVVSHMQAAADALHRTGCTVEFLTPGLRNAGGDSSMPNRSTYSMLISPPATGRLLATDIATAPHPDFPTDLQPQMTALLATVDGTSIVQETIFDGRIRHAGELRAMGADIHELNNRTLLVRGRPYLNAAMLTARDLRGGAAMLLAALSVRDGGCSIIKDPWHMDRGYERLDEKLRSIGADVMRVMY